MNQTPRISIIVPMFNAARTLGAALRSVQNQTFRDFECLLVDDGSTDDTCRIAGDFLQSDERFRLLSNEHRGIVDALNQAVAHCRGRYVARFDADDLMNVRRLERQRDVLDAHPEWAGLGCHVNLFPREGLTAGRIAYESWLNSLGTAEAIYRDRFVECPLAHPTLLLRREILDRFSYRDMPWAEDYDLVLRLLTSGHPLGTVPEPLLEWQDSAERLSRTSERYRVEQFVACKARFLADEWLRDGETYVLWGYGSTGKALCRALATLGRKLEAIVEVHPRRIGRQIAGVRVIPPSALALPPEPRKRIIVSVAGQQPRAEVRILAQSLGLVEGRHYVCAA